MTAREKRRPTLKLAPVEDVQPTSEQVVNGLAAAMAASDPLVEIWVPAWRAMDLTPVQAVLVARACADLVREDQRARIPTRARRMVVARVRATRPHLFGRAA